MYRSLVGITLLCMVTAVKAEMSPLDAMIIPGEVIEGHKSIEHECKQCHLKFKRTRQNELCLSCHEHRQIAEDVKNKRGYHGQMTGFACSKCHTDHKGRKAKIVSLNPDTFNHKWTDFPLTGAHAKTKVKCRDCHDPGEAHRQAPSTCYACHREDDDRKGHKGSLGKECGSCHVTRDWKTVRFDHRKTDFPLLGKHREVKCKSCHKKENQKKTPTQCYSCHKQDDDRRGHQGKFGKKCESCHDARSWKQTAFDHFKTSRFALRGAHNRIKCTACHQGILGKEKLGKTCYACHRQDDVHKGQQGRKCESCHNERSWRVGSFDHGLTAFPLLGGHERLKCDQCHKNKTFKDAPVACIGCHQQDDEHKGRLGSKCETCHSARSWKDWRFDHDRQTEFALTGKHRGLKCGECHTQPMKRVRLGSTCNACHSRDDVHEGSFGQYCERCHVDSSWQRIKNLPSLRQ